MIRKETLPSPAVIVDLDVAERNIQRVASAAKTSCLNLRPHIKVHKSVYFARKQIESGAKGITVAKIAEAETMANYGFNDILIAYPVVGEEKIERLKKLHERINVTTIADSIEVASALARIGSPDHPFPVLIDIDSGIHRGGRQPGKDTMDFALKLNGMDGLKIQGLFTYNGGIYLSKSREEMAQSAESEAKLLSDMAQLLKNQGIKLSVLSGGSTPAVVVLDHLQGITEIRSGNYLFYDVSALALGIAQVEDCALRVLSTVVSTPLPGYASIDAGSKTLTTDLSAYEGYGYVVGKPDVKIVKLNEEHGFLRFDPNCYQFRVGDRVEVIPNHACVLPNLCDVLYGIREGVLEREIPVEARGKNF
ncbi:MAG: alanine racemase [Desulfitobacteriaceae bacterium]